MGKFAGFLADYDHVSTDAAPGIIKAFSSAIKASLSGDVWIIDSGATDHMSNRFHSFKNFKKFHVPSNVSIANGKSVPVLGEGKITIMSDMTESCVYYVPGFPFQLLSVSKLLKTLKCLAIFSENGVFFQDKITKKRIGEGFLLDGLYYLSKTPAAVSNSLQAFSVSPVSDEMLWHQRLAHPSNKVLSVLFPDFCNSQALCEICVTSKFSRLPFNLSQSRTSKCFELVHSDIWGPAPVDSVNGYKYYALFIDDFSRVTWLYLLKLKSELKNAFIDFHNLVINHFSSKIHVLRSDNGAEYTSNAMTEYLSKNGIIHETSCVATPQQNGVSERKNRDLLEKTRSLLFQMNVPKKYLSYAVLTATYIINRLPTRVLNGKSPWQVLKGRDINLSHLRVFGCSCYVRVQPKDRDKLDPKAVKMVFLGYSPTQKGYKCYNPKTRKVLVSRDVKFDESTPFFQQPLSKNELQWEFSVNTECGPSETPIDRGVDQPVPSTPTSNNDDGVTTESHEQEDENGEEDDHHDEFPIQPRRNPPRTRNLPTKLLEYETYVPKYPMSNFISYNKLSFQHSAFFSKISSVVDPKNFSEAMQQPQWRHAMDEEIKALAENQTWSVVTIPDGKKAVG